MDYDQANLCLLFGSCFLIRFLFLGKEVETETEEVGEETVEEEEEETV